MSAKHTPGPWEAFKGVEEGDDLRCGVSAMRGEIGYLVATIENGAPGDFCETEFANAHLIAAAPEGFDLIEQLEESFTADGAYSQFLPAMRAYLAKARGES